jgi:hypothetical protein
MGSAGLRLRRQYKQPEIIEQSDLIFVLLSHNRVPDSFKQRTGIDCKSAAFEERTGVMQIIEVIRVETTALASPSDDVSGCADPPSFSVESGVDPPSAVALENLLDIFRQTRLLLKSAKGAARTARSERNFAPRSVLRVFLRRSDSEGAFGSNSHRLSNLERRAAS